MKIFRIMLEAEDGIYCIEDGFFTYESAHAALTNLEAEGIYGEYQILFIESYNRELF